MISVIYLKIHYLSTHILLGLRLHYSKIFWKALVLVIDFFSFKGTTNAYLLKILIAHNKNQILLLNLLIKYISAGSAPQMNTSIKDEHNLRSSDSLIYGSRAANYWFDIILYLIADLFSRITAPPETYILSKIF